MNITTYDLFVILMCIKEEFSKQKSQMHVYIHYFILYIIVGKNIPRDSNTVRLYVMIFLKNCMHINLHYWTIQSQFSYRFFSAIYYTLNLSLDFLVTLNLYTTLLRCFVFLVLILSRYKCMPPAHPLYVVMTTVIGLLCFTVLYLYSYFDP